MRAAIRAYPPLAGDLVAGGDAGRLPVRARSARSSPTPTTASGSRGSSTPPASRSQPMDAVQVHSVACAGGDVRFRPHDDATQVKREATIRSGSRSAMDRSRTADAVHVAADGKAVAGREHVVAETARRSWSTRRRRSPFGAKVTVERRPHCRVPLPAPTSVGTTRARFRRSSPSPVGRRARHPDRRQRRGHGQLARASRPYYLRLMNCTRTGGWVTSGGACSSPGRPERRAAHAERDRSRRGSRGRTRSASRPTTSATTSSAGRRATACGAPASAATAGARTSAAGRATRTAPSSARTCSSRASGRTTAATTRT